MKKFLIMLLAALPVSMWAQDNNWEIAEEEQQEAVKPEKSILMRNTSVGLFP